MPRFECRESLVQVGAWNVLDTEQKNAAGLPFVVYPLVTKEEATMYCRELNQAKRGRASFDTMTS
jgi:Cu2+-containing amine oxidase